jgi:signal transduction histidine kinase
VNSAVHPPEFFRDLWGTITRGEIWRGEICNRAKDGMLYWVDTTIVPFLNDDGKPYQYVSIRYDITERKRSEEKLRDQASLAQLGKLAAVVAHEVRNPLAAIRGALQVIGGRLAPASQEHAVVQEVITRVDGLNEILQDMLQFARPRLPLLTAVSLTGFLDSVVSMFAGDAAVARVSVEMDVTEVLINVDVDQLQQAVLNLLINSAQAMHGEGRITVTTSVDAGHCVIALRDQGPGIPADVREHLFEPFFTTKHRGTGLGLATARRILDSHGGTLTLESPQGGGTIARIRVPLARA